MKRSQFIKTLALLPVIAPAMSLNELYQISQQLPKTKRMPVLFIGHGSPMNAIETNEFSNKWKELGKQIPLPSAVLCISAHWLTRGTAVTAMEHPKTIHDFGGFPKALFDVEYPAPGNPALALETKNLIKSITWLNCILVLSQDCIRARFWRFEFKSQ